MTAYKRAIAEAPALDLELLQGLSEALVADGRQREAAEYLTEQTKLAEADKSMDVVNLDLLLGRVRFPYQACILAIPQCLPCSSDLFLWPVYFCGRIISFWDFAAL